MMTIRRIAGDDLLDHYFPLLDYAFRGTPPQKPREELSKVLPYLENVTVMAAFEEERALACAGSWPMRQNVRGAVFPMGAIWGVATHPEARRKGYSRRVLLRLLEALRTVGTPLTCLYPFRESFYERLGYVTFPQIRVTRFSPLTLRGLLRRDLPGEVALSPLQTGLDEYRAYLRERQAHIHGLALFGDRAAERLRNREEHWLALARDGDNVIGAMIYRIEEYAGKMQVFRFLYNNNRGRFLLLHWLARHADQASEIEISLAPYELPETWLADMDVRIGTPDGDTPMGRVLDVQRIGGLRTGPGAFTARVHDEVAPWNNGGFRFETVDGALRVSEGTDAECDLTIQALSALVYGTHDPDVFALRGWGEPSPRLQATMRAMFPLQRPYLHEEF